MRYSTDDYNDNYPDGVETHYWHRARNAILARALASFDCGRILDVGCGRGTTVQHLRARGFDCRGCELGRPDVVADARPFVVVDRDAAKLPADQRDAVRTIMLLDVIEHIEDSTSFIAELVAAFRNLQWLVITVPARPELWTNYDEFYRHHRRYTTASLRAEIEAAVPGARMHTLRYFFHGLYLPALAARLIARRRNPHWKPPRHLWLHALIAKTSLAIDAAIPDALPGSSALAIVELPA